jgi:hypothetical protein
MNLIQEKLENLERRIKHFEFLEERNSYKKDEFEKILSEIIFLGLIGFIGFILGILIMI